MNKNISVCIITMSILCSGCATTSEDRTTAACQPLSDFKTMVIAPVNSESAFVEESKYRHLLKAIAMNTNELLKEQLEDRQLFNKIVQSSDCQDSAIKLEVSIGKLTHHRGEFEVEFKGKIINCQNGESLYTFDDDEDSDESDELPENIADNLVESIETNLNCS